MKNVDNRRRFDRARQPCRAIGSIRGRPEFRQKKERILCPKLTGSEPHRKCHSANSRPVCVGSLSAPSPVSTAGSARSLEALPPPRPATISGTQAMRKMDRNSALDGKNRRFYLCDQMEVFLGLPRRRAKAARYAASNMACVRLFPNLWRAYSKSVVFFSARPAVLCSFSQAMHSEHNVS